MAGLDLGLARVPRGLVVVDRVRRGGGTAGTAGEHRALAHVVGAPQVGGEIAQPVAVGREHEVVGADAAERRGDLLPLGRRGGGEALAHAAPARVDHDLAAGLGIDHPDVADRRQLQLARVADLDGHDAVAGAQAAQRRLPVARAAEVGHDHDQAARPREPGHRGRGLAERRRAGALGRGSVAQLGEQAQQAGAALARAQHARLRAAERDDPEPVPAPRRHVADGERDALRDIGLAP